MRAWSPGRVVRIVNMLSQLQVAGSAPMLALVTETILEAHKEGRLYVTSCVGLRRFTLFWRFGAASANCMCHMERA